MKRKKGILFLSLPVIVLAIGVLSFFLLRRPDGGALRGRDSLGDGTYVLTIDGYGVTQEEFELFLSDQKAITANYFWTKYQVQPDARFWTTEFGGETPIDYAKQRALNALVRSKIEFILAAERDIFSYRSYAGLLESMETENADRIRKKESGEVFYGLTEFTPFTYYSYLNSNIRSELEHSQRELAKPTDAALRRVYEDHYEAFHLGVVYEYEVYYADGARETVSQSSLEVGKEDYTTEDLIERFNGMQVGDSIREYSYRGRSAEIILRGKTSQGYAPFKEVKESLQALFAREELSRLVQARADVAEVEINQARFGAINMP